MRLLNSLLVIIRIRSRSQVDCLEQRKNNPGHRVSIGFSLFFLFLFLFPFQKTRVASSSFPLVFFLLFYRDFFLPSFFPALLKLENPTP